MPLPLIHYLYASGLPKYLRKSSSGDPSESSWALITGASDGIGFALAHELACRGFNILLHGRNVTKLTSVSSKLSTGHPTRLFRTIIADAGSFTSADISQIENTSLYIINVLFPLTLTRALLPHFQSLNRPTLILTCGSQVQVGQPYIAAYSGCKAALHAWNRALGAELRRNPKTAQIEVLEVVDEVFAATGEGLFMPSAERMAREILRRVGLGHANFTPYFWHMVMGSVMGLLPERMVDGLVAGLLEPSVEKVGE
ncbi:hypothetical protein BCR34DRAFT_633290 [Clohesyomyces aquaticus]|uniref:NAD(P)-binding protein n=1 Tax=Clohesyomyces aquaticus TaxID=1231657 RepID=A0A1Y2A409_9PLEO|nr:hypothetical protein BCR34DRAFT_633290 [Clohesyomyces aquaticus]